MSGLAILLIGVGGFLCYEAYMAIHDKRAATPVTTALKAAKS